MQLKSLKVVLPSLSGSAITLLLSASIALATPCGTHNVSPRVVESGVVFNTPGLSVDADGAPNSYRVDGKGLSDTCDGVTAVGSTPKTDKEHWLSKCRRAWANAQATGDYSGVRIFGFAKDRNNRPIIQRAGDPLPGEAYISETSVSVPDGPPGTQRHWIDATQIPYIVLSKSFVSTYRVRGGDVAVVYWPTKGTYAFGIYGDGGDLGEASIRLHQDLGSSPLVIRNGVTRAKAGIGSAVVTVVFPGQATNPTVVTSKWLSEIQEKGKRALQAWGGLDRLKSCIR